MLRLSQLVHPAARTFAGWRCGWRQEGELLSSDHNLQPVAVVTAASCSSCRIGIGECEGSLVNPLHSSCPSSCRQSSAACAAVVDVGRLGWLCRARSSAFGSLFPSAVAEVLDVAAFRFETSEQRGLRCSAVSVVVDAAATCAVLQSRSSGTDTCARAIGQSTLRTLMSPRVLLLGHAWARRGRGDAKDGRRRFGDSDDAFPVSSVDAMKSTYYSFFYSSSIVGTSVHGPHNTSWEHV